MDNGWIKLHRSVLHSDIMCRPKVLPVWIYILLSAVHTNSHVGIRDGSVELKPGQVFLTIPELVKNTKLTAQNIRTSLKHLISTCRITCKSTRRGSVISVVNWGAYQQTENESNRQPNRQNNRQVTDSQQTNKNKECKNNINTNILNIGTAKTPSKKLSDVYEIYKLYPAKCPARGSNTGKSSKNKDKIATVLATGYPLKKAVEWYLAETAKSGAYLKNFSTFLNNLPDVEDIKQTSATKPGVKSPIAAHRTPSYHKPLTTPLESDKAVV